MRASIARSALRDRRAHSLGRYENAGRVSRSPLQCAQSESIIELRMRPTLAWQSVLRVGVSICLSATLYRLRSRRRPVAVADLRDSICRPQEVSALD